MTWLTAMPILLLAEPFAVLHGPDETSLLRVKADPPAYIGKQITVVGGLRLGDYYNYGYSEAQSTHASISFRELGDDSSKLGESATLYASHYYRAAFLKQLVEVLERDIGDDRLRLARLKIVLTKRRYNDGEQWDLFELNDAQFPVGNKLPIEWGPWVVEAANKKERDEEAERDRKYFELQAKQEAALAAETEAKRPQLRDWTQDGKRIKAKFGGVIAGKVILKTQDNQTLKVSIETLGNEDREYIKGRTK